MRFDLSPLYRSTVGFERLANLLENTGGVEPTPNWPPYNVERSSQGSYRIVMALPGFSPEELELVQQENVLTITGKREAKAEDVEVLHRGIVAGTFRKTFHLAEYVKVKDAKFEAGLLTVELEREVPEALRPRRIDITAGTKPSPQIEGSQAA